MIKINPESINDLVALSDSGVPVTMTSHPGNASLYKLSLWACGIPEHLWDITCCKADANNWPMHRLVGGCAELVVSADLHSEIIRTTNPKRRYVTAYQVTEQDARLGRVHVRAMQPHCPTLSSCSRLLLAEKELVWEMFDYLATTRRESVFARQINGSGVMEPLSPLAKTQSLATSFVDVLEELDHLLFSDEPITTRGGACYDGASVQVAGMLVDYWRTGRIDRYDISGPDMIHYATQPAYQAELSDLLHHLRRWKPERVPEHMIVHMPHGTVARVGHVVDHASEDILARKECILQNESRLAREEKVRLSQLAREDELIWPITIRPSQDKYFSQHDLAMDGACIAVSDYWRNIPISSLKDTLCRANNLLRIRGR